MHGLLYKYSAVVAIFSRSLGRKMGNTRARRGQSPWSNGKSGDGAVVGSTEYIQYY